ncbi:hypothetical protein K450DRAFT_195077 [Umbelopsis ramanniana AG]|uniref:Uncharacterized protein n=1 Tax=Umbelopsis ramanniana AG TaxID=1314678 RepID=A0AAD5EJL3_UMBRA|nr:uncharacterized protein K450DRAFT_195077 [Umbelopsis ramanniana AG]KAI8584662.1 hypothetical protein K450DRAFT_195077 [Umbelopsis ramanniana AG]
MLNLHQSCLLLCSLLIITGLGLASTIFIPVNPFYQLLLMENSAFPWIHFVIYCVYAVVGTFGILVCRQRIYSKAKIFTIASWTFLLLALPWDVTDLVMANELQNHAHIHCYNYNEPPDLKAILNFDISCDEIKLAPPVVGVVSIMLLLLKLYYGVVITGWTLRLRTEEQYAKSMEESYEPSWVDYNNDENIMQHYFEPVKRY